MPSFSYRAVGKNGKEQAGVLTAESYLVALRMLEEQALLSDPGQRWSAVGQNAAGPRSAVKRADLTTFYSQLADLLRAGCRFFARWTCFRERVLVGLWRRW